MRLLNFVKWDNKNVVESTEMFLFCTCMNLCEHNLVE